MFDKFGEVNSYKELNEMAAAQLAEGDEDAIMEIAKENGIDIEDAEDFIDGVVEEFCTPVTAAIGKLEMEKQAMKPVGACGDIVDELIRRCTEDRKLAEAVRRKGKNLKQYMANCLDYGWKHSWDVPKDVMSKTKDLQKIMHGHMCKVGLPNKKEARTIADQYYMGD